MSFRRTETVERQDHRRHSNIMSTPVTHHSLRRLLLACVSANMGGLLVGIQLAIFSGILEMSAFSDAMAPQPVDAGVKSLITSSLIVGTILGSFPAGPICDRAGRRPALLLTAASFALGTVVMARAKNILQVCVGRFLAGLAYAIANIVCPMYSAELSPLHLRGIIVNLYQLSITLGIFLAQLVNWAFWADEMWNQPLLLAFLPSIGMVFAVYAFVPESPSWLTEKGRALQARAAAHWLQIEHREEDSQEIAEAGGDSDKLAKQNESKSFLQMLQDASARRRLLIGVGLGAAQQLTGINGVIFFGPALVADILRLSGSSAPFRAATIVGFANFLATVLSMGVIERFGRRQLLLGVGPLMISALVTIGLMRDGLIHRSGFVGIGALLTFICGFAIAHGPLTFLVQSEIFPVRYKGVAMSTCSMIMNTFSLGIAAGFLPLLEVFAGRVYYFHAACIVASSIFIAVCVPETRNLSLKDIDRLLS